MSYQIFIKRFPFSSTTRLTQLTFRVFREITSKVEQLHPAEGNLIEFFLRGQMSRFITFAQGERKCRKRCVYLKSRTNDGMQKRIRDEKYQAA